MKTGVIEILPDEDIEPRKGSLRTSGNFPPPGNNGGNDGGDDGKPKGKYRPMKDDPDRSNPENQDKSKIVTWFLLLVVMMTFGGLIGAYVVISTNNVAEWQPFNLPIPVFISTALIFISSVTYDFGKRALYREGHIGFDSVVALDLDNAENSAPPESNSTVSRISKIGQKLVRIGRFIYSIYVRLLIRFRKISARFFFVSTTVLGAAFISSQILAWLALVNKGLYMQGNPYAGFFYILTGIHAVHVLGGIVALGAILLRSWNYTEYGPELEYRRNLALSVGWYWHFMGVLWIVLFLLLGFWK